MTVMIAVFCFVHNAYNNDGNDDIKNLKANCNVVDISIIITKITNYKNKFKNVNYGANKSANKYNYY